MAFATIDYSPLADGPARIYYRNRGEGVPVIFLHGGWGYEIYPLDRQFDALRAHRILIPDRSGYGKSTKPAVFSADFHRRAVVETLSFLDALNIQRCHLWGHSDGAAIAAMLGLTAPDRCISLILEAFHYDRKKPGSRAFFESMATAPESLGERVCTTLEREHGKHYWHELIRNEGEAWLEIARKGSDLYDGKLSELTVPALFIHGGLDPRTEPGELDAVHRELPGAAIHMLQRGGHSPHSEAPIAEECSRLVHDFLQPSRKR